jgi:NAD(P)-dependent dehydrogenase (short-subunit alcohol dehydrogenase family)
MTEEASKMDLQLSGKVVMITGGSKGIGLACARLFAREGAHVAIVSRNSANLGQAREQLHAEGLHAHASRADLHEPASAETAVDDVWRTLGPVDVLINSAGAAKRYDPDTLDAAAYAAAIEAKYYPYVFTQQAVLRRMSRHLREHPGATPGNVVNIIGIGGKVATDIHIAGGAANAALMLATVGLAHHYAPLGIRINAINPGQVMTTRAEEALALQASQAGISRDEALAAGEARVPMRRYASPDEVADVALFLASARAAYVSGAIIPMDGVSTPVI